MRDDTVVYELRRSALPERKVRITRVTPPEFGRVLLDPRFDQVRHSPDGFEFGYGGSGPSQAAFAILADFLGDDQWALREYQSFKRAFVEPIGGDAAEIRGADVRAWLEGQVRP